MKRNFWRTTVVRTVGLLLAGAGLGCASPERLSSRLIVLGLDGLDPRVVELLVREGKLPNLARLRREGAYAPLVVEPPLLSPILWTSIATGKRAAEHGIGHFTATDAAGREIPITSNLRRVEALWNIASRAGQEVGVVGWWATWPAESVHGVMVSDHTCYHFLKEPDSGEELAATGAISPPDATAGLLALVRRPESVTPREAAQFVDVPAAELARPFDFADDLSHFKWALATTYSYRDIGLALWRDRRPDLLMVYFEATDSTAHLFGHLFRRTDLAGALAEQQRRYGRAVESMYLLADEIVGEYLAVMDERTTLVVLSDHGFDLGVLPTDPSKLQDMRRVSERFHRDRGVLYLYGHGIRAGVALSEPGILDVAPTLLALAGLPAGTDMPGRVLGEALSGIPIPERVATHEPAGGRVVPKDAEGAGLPVADPAADQALLAQLTALGYLGEAKSGTSDRNLAFLLLQDRRYAEAAEAFKRLLERSGGRAGEAAVAPEAALTTGYASALAGLGQEQLALRYFAAAIAADPIFAPAFHNRGLLLERLGRLPEAVADFRAALRYDADYEPARRALARLGVSAGVVASTAEEKEAAGLLSRAIGERKRGDYVQARELLEQAEKLAPAAAVYQELANVAYLAGDRAGAIAALERALKLEPENALLRHNLEGLQRAPAAGERP